jgi:X-Pro dipeptidyl-peptidase C-terminal non-catalytic domain
MDYVMRGGPKPALLKDKINFEVMGANEWQHAPSLAQMAQQQTPFYFSSTLDGGRHSLVRDTEKGDSGVTETVDLADRSTWNNSHYYPRSILETKLEDDGQATEMVYMSKPFAQAQVVSGAFSGELQVTINKKDADPRPDGIPTNAGWSVIPSGLLVGPCKLRRAPRDAHSTDAGKSDQNTVRNGCGQPSDGPRKPPSSAAGRR